MQPRNLNEQFSSTITFQLANPEQEKCCSTEYSDQLEALGPTIAWNLALNCKIPAKSITIKLFRNAPMTAFGIEVALEMEGATQLDVTQLKENNAESLLALIKQSLVGIDPKNILQIEKLLIIDAACDTAPCQKSAYCGKVKSREYSYNSSDKTDEISINFLNEFAHTYRLEWHTQDIKYDRWSNITSIEYGYNKSTKPAEYYINALITDAKAIIDSNPSWQSFITSLKAQDFNQALRRASAVGASALVNLLLKYNQNEALDLNIDSYSPSTNKTAMDYAHEYPSVKLILANAGAKTFAELRLAMVDQSRQSIPNHKTNARHDAPSKTFNQGIFSPMAVFNRADHESAAERLNEQNRLRQEAKLKAEREAIERMRSENAFLRFRPGMPEQSPLPFAHQHGPLFSALSAYDSCFSSSHPNKHPWEKR